MPSHQDSKQSDAMSASTGFVILSDTMDSSQSDMPEIFRTPIFNNLNLHEISVDELQHHYDYGVLSAYDYVKFCLDRIQKVHGC